MTRNRRGPVFSSVCWLRLPFFVVPWLPRAVFGALPYLPTGPTRLHAMLDRLPPRVAGRGARFLDLGSGDGEAVLVAASRGLVAHGVELNPSLVAFSRLRAWRAASGATFSWGNLFDAGADVARSDVVFVFGVVPLMPRIAAMLAERCHPGAFVCVHKFPLRGCGWEAAQVDAVGDITIYDRARLPPGPAPPPPPPRAQHGAAGTTADHPRLA